MASEFPMGTRVWFAGEGADGEHVVDEWEIYSWDEGGGWDDNDLYALRPAGPDVDKRPLGTFWAPRSQFVPILPEMRDPGSVEAWLAQ